MFGINDNAYRCVVESNLPSSIKGEVDREYRLAKRLCSLFKIALVVAVVIYIFLMTMLCDELLEYLMLTAVVLVISVKGFLCFRDYMKNLLITYKSAYYLVRKGCDDFPDGEVLKMMPYEEGIDKVNFYRFMSYIWFAVGLAEGAYLIYMLSRVVRISIPILVLVVVVLYPFLRRGAEFDDVIDFVDNDFFEDYDPQTKVKSDWGLVIYSVVLLIVGIVIIHFPSISVVLEEFSSTVENTFINAFNTLTSNLDEVNEVY